MNFDFSDDQKFLKDQARKFLTEKCGMQEVRKVLDDASMPFHRGLWASIAELGWTGAAIAEEHGGLGMGPLELCVLAEEIGRSLAPTPFASTVFIVAEALSQFGDDAQKAAWLPKIATGETIGCYAVTERAGVVDPARLACKFEGGKLTGVKLPVTDGDVADVALVLAAEGKGASLVLVDLSASGVTREVVETIDPTRSHAKLTFDGAAAQRIGAAGDGAAMHGSLMNRFAVYTAFEQIGGADRALEMANAYAKERFAFGRPIGGNQAIKHKLADMWVKNEVARSHAYYGAWALSTNAPELGRAAAAARVAACEASWFAAKENIQTHGGMGFTWEVDCHLLYRRSKLLCVQGEPAAVWKEKLVRELEQANA